ncbi:hypothetical protein [Streptomyces spectabilis]|uniref:Toxin-antitoxin system HicB family antitoxin n=1 Tax=Streptomyces spectabilis TaxID=68270 RepID=A0A516RGI9_STRST|nr:hypothetical protein [Streptomyces spectabilis]QDQ14770.1 hypothetical protein FH965_32935 [Streptomyces spectabilis]
MELTRYVDHLRQELAAAVDSGDEETRDLAGRLIAPLGSAVRLTLLDALSAAVDEITRDMAPGSVEVRLRGLDPTFVVTLPPQDRSFGDEGDRDHDRGSPGVAPSLVSLAPLLVSGDEGATSRINFRPPEHLKARIEEAAGREQLSVNAWLVRAVTATLEYDDRGRRVDQRAAQAAPASAQRYTGWVN